MRIIEACKELGIPAELTSTEHKNGLERLSEFAEKVEADIYVTIQGDEPLLEPKSIEAVLETLNRDADIMCATLKTPYNNPVDVINGTTPKIATDLSDNALLFTRSPIPYPKAAIDYIIYKPIGVYAWRRELLLRYRHLEMGPLERAEEIELLRLLEHGYKIKVGVVDSVTVAVDTQKDLERVRDFLKHHPEYQTAGGASHE